MDGFTDTAGNNLSHVALVLAPEIVSSVFVVGVPCLAGRYLAAAAGALAFVEARRTGSGDPFVALDESPISLSPYAGEVVNFDFRVTTLASDDRAGESLEVRATFQP